MCNALPSGVPTAEDLLALSVEDKLRLSAGVISSYPRGIDEAAVLSSPLTFVLGVLLESRLPTGNMIASPSQIVAWLGEGASLGKPSPANYVWGKLRNQAYSGGLTENREEEWSDAYIQDQDQMPAAQIEETLARAQAWERLPPEDQETLELDLEYSVKELAQFWGLSVDGAENRIYRARKKLKQLYSM